MSARLSKGRGQGSADLVWPGFVDALSSLLLVIIFLLSIFVLAQFFLGQALSGRDEALAELRLELAELGDLLALEKSTSDALRDEVSSLASTLQATRLVNTTLNAQVASLQNQFADAQERLAEAARAQAEAQASISNLATQLSRREEELDDERRLSAQARAEVERLNQNIEALRRQMAALQDALDAADERDEKNKVVIAELGKRLNTALAGKVEELAGYRSEFFGRLRALLGAHPDIVVQGDRFVFQSELLFASGSATLGEEGKRQLAPIAGTIIALIDTIPSELDWVLRVDGHTDILPISTPEFPSNWELSTARALSVVRYLISQGVPPQRLAAAGFGPYQPINTGQTRDAYRQNRRIELRLDQR